MERYNINVTIRHGDSNSRYNRESIEALRLALIMNLLGKENAKRVLEYIEVNNLQIKDVYKYMRQIVDEDNTEYTELLIELLNDSDFSFDDYKTFFICLDHICMSVILQNKDTHDYIAYEANDGENYSTRSLGSTYTDGEYLNRLVGEIFKQYQGESLLNADCGIGSFLTFENERKSEKEIDGLCINRKAYNIAQLGTSVG